jgi:hypothetical protein
MFRWHDSGDVQDEAHLMKIFEVCELSPEKRHWLPTREAWTNKYLDQAPGNLTIRFSMPMVDQEAGWLLVKHFNGCHYSRRKNLPSS